MLFIVDRQRLQSDKSVVSAALEEDRTPERKVLRAHLTLENCFKSSPLMFFLRHKHLVAVVMLGQKLRI